MVRYADDFVILCRSPEEAANALALVQQWTAEAGLKLHPDQDRQHADRCFDFLGYRFQGGVAPAAEEPAEAQGGDRAKTKRTSGESFTKIIAT